MDLRLPICIIPFDRKYEFGWSMSETMMAKGLAARSMGNCTDSPYCHTSSLPFDKEEIPISVVIGKEFKIYAKTEAEIDVFIAASVEAFSKHEVSKHVSEESFVHCWKKLPLREGGRWVNEVNGVAGSEPLLVPNDRVVHVAQLRLCDRHQFVEASIECFNAASKQFPEVGFSVYDYDPDGGADPGGCLIETIHEHFSVKEGNRRFSHLARWLTGEDDETV